jgi:uncharacterized membrane protein
MWIRFLIYGLLGWGVEVLWTGLGSVLRRDPRLTGHTYLWMFLIYGSAALLLEPVHRLIAGYPWPVRGLVWVVVIFVLEFASGWMLRQATGTCPWDYSGTRFAVAGLIRLDYAPAWFVLGLLFEQVHLRLMRIVPLLL